MSISIPYARMMEIRRALDLRLYYEDQGPHYRLAAQDNGIVLNSLVTKLAPDGTTANPEALDFETNVMPFANLPIEMEEVRFETHDFSHKGTWSGETTGDPAASWAAERGAVGYDDVSNLWYGVSGETICQLDQINRVGGYDVWRDTLGNPIVHYVPPASGDARDGDWIRIDTGEIVTSSRWRILPYDGHKISITETVLSCDSTAVIQEPLHYEVYAYYPPAEGVVKVRDWAYPDIYVIRAGADRAWVEPIVLDGHMGNVIHYVFDYTKTKIQSVDSRYMQRLDILTENDARVINTNGATATFVAKKIRSF